MPDVTRLLMPPWEHTALSTTTYKEKDGEWTPQTKEMLSPSFCSICGFFFFFNTSDQSEQPLQPPGCGASWPQEGSDGPCEEIPEKGSEAKLELLSLNSAMSGQERENKTPKLEGKTTSMN